MNFSSRVGVIISAAAAAFWIGQPIALGFMASEEQQFRAEVEEARARARDFERTLERMAREARERESAAREMTVIRERAEREDARAREEFIVERNQRPDPNAGRDRLEREWEREREREAKKMEADRQAYVRAREKVRQVIEREAHIDEKKEYGL